MSDPDTNGRWLPIQIAPDACDLELGRRHKTGILPWSFPCRGRSGVWFNIWTDEAVLTSPLADLAVLAVPPLDADAHI